MFTPAEAQLLHAFLKNAKPQATNMEQAVREAINYQRAVELVNRETKPELTPAQMVEIEAAARKASEARKAEAAVAERAQAKERELAAVNGPGGAGSAPADGGQASEASA